MDVAEDSCGNLLGSLSSMSVSVLLSSVNVSEGSHSTSSGSVSSNGFCGPTVSSLLGATSKGCGLSLLQMEVGFSTDSTDSVGVSMFFTSCWSSSCLKKHGQIAFDRLTISLPKKYR